VSLAAKIHHNVGKVFSNVLTHLKLDGSAIRYQQICEHKSLAHHMRDVRPVKPKRFLDPCNDSIHFDDLKDKQASKFLANM